ncbi:dipeptide transport ATP-binding protein DppD [Nonlabens ulvanivorans]|nr:dipeptide transport ATP-binding protein DppD [Nonlabens ulvanivorans]
MTKSLQNKPLAIINNLNVSFRNGKLENQVLFDVSLELFENEILAVVGESGSGKSVTSKALMGLLPVKNAIITAKELSVMGNDLQFLKGQDWSRFRGSVISMIFQEPMSSLNPTITCGHQVAEILEIHTKLTNKDIKTEVLRLFEKVKLPIPEQTFNKYPHEISGGQMQRVMIAMAIACKPKILIADEPTTALDVTVQKEIILLLKELQAEYGMSVLFISHDLGLVHEIADRIAVMYKGRVVEIGTPDQLFEDAQETYTKALIAARPDTKSRLKRLPTINDFMHGTVPSTIVSDQERNENHKRLYAQKPLLELVNVVKKYPLKKELFKGATIFHRC